MDDVLDQSQNMMKVIGVGGAGSNAIDRMIDAGLCGLDFIALNTDRQALDMCEAPIKLQIGRHVTKGLGAGSDPEVGRRSAEEDREVIAEVLDGADMVFITAGMGGGTGTGAAPVIAEISKELGALTVAIVTLPFDVEGKIRMQHALEGIEELKSRVDATIVIPNEKLLSLIDENEEYEDALRKVDDVLYRATKGISDLINVYGRINLDFSDVKTIMSMGGDSYMGMGIATGSNRAIQAAQEAISCPLMEEISIKGAKGLLINVSANKPKFKEYLDACKVIMEAVGDNAHIIKGLVDDPSLDDEFRVTVVATGFGKKIERPIIDIQKKVVDLNDVKRELKQDEKFVQEEQVRETHSEKKKVSGLGNSEMHTVPAFLRKKRD
ncbi:MAG: cell division protein FtsZ [Candidatus Coatesbacteria bacterium]|nr:cell division protein FtsZ [Candidatus Coatesbacteria bacterium]